MGAERGTRSPAGGALLGEMGVDSEEGALQRGESVQSRHKLSDDKKFTVGVAIAETTGAKVAGCLLVTPRVLL
jgi:hypothetical protein